MNHQDTDKRGRSRVALRTFAGGWSEVEGKPGLVRRREENGWRWQRTEDHELGVAAAPVIAAIEAHISAFETRDALAAAVRRKEVSPDVDSLVGYAVGKIGLDYLSAVSAVEHLLRTLRLQADNHRRRFKSNG